ncbi:MAG: LamG-like jellyroll fold domain-containing protein [Bacteroidales bacterium]|nr:LamG-like jellyroll fold domain-containing protein [Bacteroidales bacterium]
MKLKNLLLLASAFAVAGSAGAQAYKDGYVDWGGGSEYWPTQLNQLWGVNGYVNDDDNFFISRVKPHARFRNEATQVRQGITAENDKHLVAWVPVNNTLNNALPDGIFDSECFTMWSYVTHWGNWTAPIGRIPGGFLDVAHKNGVPVSGVASIPYGSLTGSQWESKLKDYANSDPELAARFFRYYGIDGMGYNSEFAGGQAFIKKLREFHAGLVKAARKDNPLFENIWYDGTNDNSTISFDRGLGTHNQQTFGDGDNVRTSLFFNYNWNRASLLSSSVDFAKSIKRNPLDLYAGVNMQGNEPATNNWPLLKDYPISIGLWGAHSNNMFWESRGEKGSDPAVQQDSYFQRIERWFTGGTRNPANCPDIIVSNKYNVENYKFHGMSSMMTARSPLCWDLAEEPFITYFNVGNGKFFNFEGQRQHNGEWYNISAQDYQPTWHYWFASKLLGRDAADVPATGLDAQYTWDDAWFGGSTVKITGNTDNEYLHLFKTEYTLKRGDVITFRYKLNKGQGNVNLVLTAKGAETKPINETDFNVMTPALLADEDVWETRSFTVGDELDGKDLALIALHFENARGLELVLGEFSIVRGTSATPATPVLAKAETLSFNRNGLDAKLIWNMPNDKAAGEPCYNLDVNTSFFKVYAQQEGAEPVLMGVSTSWADLIYNVPVNVNADVMKVRYGVSAVSLDHKSESPIAWSEYQVVSDYAYSEDVTIDKTVIKPGEDFTIGYVDPKHNAATWKITDGSDNVLYTAKNVHEFTVSEGLPEIGSYNLIVEEPVGDVPVVDIDPTSYSIQLYGTKLYLSTDEYDDNGKATCSLSSTPEYYEITPSAGGYTIKSMSSGKYVGYNSSVSTWDTADSPDAWTINNIEGEPTFIYKNATQGLGTDAREAGKGVYTDKTGVQWVIAHPEEGAGDAPAFNTRTFASFIQVSGESVGALPKIYTLTANNEEADIEVMQDEEVTLRYTGRAADGAGSQGVDLQEQRFGATAADLGVVGQKSFSVGFWLKINELASGETQLFSVANKLDTWPKTDWGWIWVNMMADGSIGSFTFRGTDATSNNELKYSFGDTKIPVGNWVHIGFAFDYNASGWFKTHFFVNGKEQNVTSVSRTSSIAGSPDKDGYHKNVYSITNGQVMAIGGSAHSRSGIKGTVDNVIVWDGVATEAMMQAAMGDIDATNLESNVLAYWDLDSEQGNDWTFTSVGQKQIPAGCHSYEAAGGEGQGVFHWTKSEYTSGCPFVKGTAYPVITRPEWRYKKAIMTEAEGNNGEQGEATIAWKQGGDYTVTLTLQNSLGSDTKTFGVVTVKALEDPNGINAPSTGEARAIAIDGQAILTFPEAGNYTVQVYNAAGQLVASAAAAITGSEHMAVRLGQQGTYIVRVVRNGEELRSIKLLNK